MSRLTGYHIMIVSKYFETIDNFIKLELVCKKFGGNMEKFHFNPIPLNFKTLGYFPKIETLHLWNAKNENFGNGFLINTKENIDCENKPVFKKEFFCIIVWFDVDFETFDRNKSLNIEFKNITYTQNDREKFGNNIPSNVKSLGDNCFRCCSSLSSIAIPSSVTSVGYGCFGECSSLGNVNIPSSVISINIGCFYKCINLSNVIIPLLVKSIDESCFYECGCLSSITIPSSVTSIGDFCFRGCISLSSITISSIITSFGDFCFCECSSLRSVTIPSCVKSLGIQCFYGCSSLGSITIPSSVTSIDNNYNLVICLNIIIKKIIEYNTEIEKIKIEIECANKKASKANLHKIT
ncbi:hypothetical protein EIN_145830 [Entamoeba invadens IP1]|uniref:Leucine rich repeat containing protein BspA family protein n=1 Tax=Entamoeba invadens IP1 TaxID=370355 RepID=L7FN66_ENTIV|nr:hypothetical protein EIN_145830 [Entamoeba invadens IP1]ELP87599.1 hypothetical protein EIN_145830 [Entamoeba invadens IP1]|eukprot:XP_004254370.1 hypothetical protein EIN_145830 [Entamoeba invadens IP1]